MTTFRPRRPAATAPGTPHHSGRFTREAKSRPHAGADAKRRRTPQGGASTGNPDATSRSPYSGTNTGTRNPIRARGVSYTLTAPGHAPHPRRGQAHAAPAATAYGAETIAVDLSPALGWSTVRPSDSRAPRGVTAAQDIARLPRVIDHIESLRRRPARRRRRA